MPTLCNYLWTHAKPPASRLESNTAVSMLTLEPQLTSYTWYLLVMEINEQVKTLSGMCTQTLAWIPNIHHQHLHKWVWIFPCPMIPKFRKLQTTTELLLGQLLKGEGHHSAYCPPHPILLLKENFIHENCQNSKLEQLSKEINFLHSTAIFPPEESHIISV